MRGAEDVAGAADLEVAHGDFEAGAEFGVLLDGLDALAGVAGGGHELAREHEVGVGLVVGAADAAAELVEIGEAEAVGAVDDDGVGVGDIEAGFDDGGGDENVDVTGDEGAHDGLEFVLAHLAVADGDGGVGDELFDARGEFVDGADAVVEEVNLAAAFEFADDGVAHGAFVVGADGGLDGLAVGRRGLDEGHVAGSHEREVEGAGDRGGGEGEDVDESEAVLEDFLVLHAEALLLVDDDEAEVFEFDVVAEEAVGADDDVDGAGGEAADGGGLFGAGAEAVEGFDGDGVVAHALAEGLGVLLGEDGRGGKEGGLFAAHDGFENGADGDFSFSKPDVAADEAVGGTGGFHVEFGVLDGAGLVGGGGEEEGGFEFVLPVGVGAEGVADAGITLGLEPEHGGGVFEDGALGFFDGALPFAVAEGGEGGIAFAEADVAADLPGLVEGDVEFAGGSKLDGEGAFGRWGGLRVGEVAARRVGVEGFEAEEFADAVVEVDDEVTGFEFGVVHAAAGGGGAFAADEGAAGALAGGASEELGVGEDGEAGGGADESGGEAAFAVVEGGGVDGVVAGEFSETLPFAFVVADENDGPIFGGPFAELVEEAAAFGFVEDEVAGFESVDAGRVESDFGFWILDFGLSDYRAFGVGVGGVQVEGEVGFFPR